MQATEQKIFGIIASQVGADSSQIKRDHFLSQDLGLDSLDGVEVLMEIEDTFNVAGTIPDDEAEACKTVDDVIRLVERHVEKN
jgi:acyl carrier protein